MQHKRKFSTTARRPRTMTGAGMAGSQTPVRHGSSALTQTGRPIHGLARSLTADSWIDSSEGMAAARGSRSRGTLGRR